MFHFDDCIRIYVKKILAYFMFYFDTIIATVHDPMDCIRCVLKAQRDSR